MVQSFNKIKKVLGELNLPGDKSISHRAVMFSSLAKGTSTIENISNAEDVNSTISCFKQLGCKVEKDGNLLKITGKGFKKFKKPIEPLNTDNSGTTARLLSGILVAQDFETKIIGDLSLSARPMMRIIEPLTEMGGKIKATDTFTLPMSIKPSAKLHPIEYELPVPSAQVKSAVLLAGLHLEETTTVIEGIPSRNHTEVLLNLKTIYEENQRKIFVSKKDYPEKGEYIIPSDISSAVFFIVLTLLSKNSELKVKNVSLNPTRTGILDILKAMGAKISIENEKRKMGEHIGDIMVKSSRLKNVKIEENLIPNIIDEIPALSIAGLFAEGKFEISGAMELRFKETDRIKALCNNFKALGLNAEEFDDGFSVYGDIKNKAIKFESYDDHRIAMAMSILSMLLKDGGNVNNFECVSISNPNFLSQLKSILK
ncbi:MAG: 3-phosphoshikimate 1-carboxyvinyltransferase [Ignavibacteriales bacterium]|nr:3-phosphoshikimate 1-carboxyvinyltransferase [Ignavibacteriales bacterium]